MIYELNLDKVLTGLILLPFYLFVGVKEQLG